MAAQEIEIKFLQVDHSALRQKLDASGAQRRYAMRSMRRLVFNWPERTLDSFVRVRDEGDRVTMTYKAYDNDAEVEKLETTVGDFATAVSILERMGATVKSKQESRREEWVLDGCKVQLDEWPWLRPFIEIKGDSEQAVQAVTEKLGFNHVVAVRGSVNEAYKDEYVISKGAHICDEPIIAFDKPLPAWLKKLSRKD